MICAQCEEDFSRKRLRCYKCGACEECCNCLEPDTEGYDPDNARFDRDELGLDPEDD